MQDIFQPDRDGNVQHLDVEMLLQERKFSSPAKVLKMFTTAGHCSVMTGEHVELVGVGVL